MIWAILNDIKYLNLINGLFSSKKDFMIEEDIFEAFKVLGLDVNNFRNTRNSEILNCQTDPNVRSYFIRRSHRRTLLKEL